ARAAVGGVWSAGDHIVVRHEHPPLTTRAVLNLCEEGVKRSQIFNRGECFWIVRTEWSASTGPAAVVGPPKARDDVRSSHGQHPRGFAECRLVVRMSSIDNHRMRGNSPAQIIGIFTVDHGPVPVSVHAHLLQFIVQGLPVLGRRKAAPAIRVIRRSAAIAPRISVIAATMLAVLPQCVPTAGGSVKIIREGPVIVMDTPESL